MTPRLASNVALAWRRMATVCAITLALGGGACPPTTPDCPPGNENCPCAENTTCSAPLECNAGSCKQRAQTGSCSITRPCGTDPVWGQLTCVAGRCEPPSCPAGEVGCPCGAGDVCQPLGVENAQCREGLCVLASCTPERAGQAGCPCNAGACVGTAVCLHGTCRDDTFAGVVVDNAAARSCDVVLRAEGQSRIRSVRFDSAVRGREVQRGNEVALAFITRADVAFSGRVANVDVFPAPVGGGSGLSVVRSSCADGQGAAVPQLMVRVE